MIIALILGMGSSDLVYVDLFVCLYFFLFFMLLSYWEGGGYLEGGGLQLVLFVK